jgi:Rnl2 family RNA ligase
MTITNKVVVAAEDEAAVEAVAWAVTHKLDGTNMSVTICREDGSVKFGRRNGYLSLDTAFYGSQAVVPPLARWASLLEAVPLTANRVTVFGELYGGGYPHPEVAPSPGSGLVQKGVFYSPQKRFAAFDIRVDNTYMDLPAAIDIFKRYDIPYVVPVLEGSFAAATEWARAHRSDDVDPSWYQVDLPIIPGNAGEGWVVRPVRETTNKYGERMMFKIKNPKFGETAPEAAPSAPSSKPEEGTSVLVTAARVSNVLGKELPETLTFKNFAHLVDLVVQDAQKEAVNGSSGLTEDKAITAKSSAVLVRAYLKSLL